MSRTGSFFLSDFGQQFTVRGRPERALSSSARTPPARYRDRRCRTVGTDVPHRSAISVCAMPSTASSTILARRASAALSARDDAILASFSRSPIRNASGPATHLPLCLRKKETFLSQH